MNAIITGHSRGLGAALAENLLSRGIAVLGLARTKHPSLGQRFPALLHELTIDLALPEVLASEYLDAVLGSHLKPSAPTLLINNAGTVRPVGPAAQQPAPDIVRAIELNVTVPLALTALVAHKLVGGELRVVHLSSGAARTAYPGWSVYCATKAALDHHARAVALDESPGIKICSLAPGVIDTDMQSEIRSCTPGQFPLRERFIAMKQDGLLAQPEAAAARLIDYLLSPAFGSEPVADLRNLGG
jgi:benzil reductase ((S)-benzoin forming)